MRSSQAKLNKEKIEWMSDDKMMKKRQQTMSIYGTEYSKLHKEIRNKYRQAKKEWLDEKCAEIERLNITDKADMH